MSSNSERPTKDEFTIRKVSPCISFLDRYKFKENLSNQGFNWTNILFP